VWDPLVARLDFLPDFYSSPNKDLFKELPKKFDPRKCHNLQVGTLDFYRKYNHGEIGDPLEGNVIFELQALGSWLEVASWLNNTTFGLFGGHIGADYLERGWPNKWPMRRPIHLDFGALHPLNEDDVPGGVHYQVMLVNGVEGLEDLVQVICKARYSALSAFVFCMKDTPNFVGIDNKNDFMFKISAPNVKKFAANVAESLAKITPTFRVTSTFHDRSALASLFGNWQFCELGFMPLNAPNGPYIHYSVGDVVYVQPGNEVKVSMNFPWHWTKQLFFRSPLFKDIKFSHHRETRVILNLVYLHDGKTYGMNPLDDVVRIPASSDLLSLLE